MPRKVDTEDKVEEQSSSAVARLDTFRGFGDISEAELLEVLEAEDTSAKGTATGESIRDAMGNVRPTLDLVQVKGHGANLYLFPNGTKVEGSEGLCGVVVAHTRHNSKYDKAFGETEKGELPDCFSNDGDAVSTDSRDPKAPTCGMCPLNRDATSREARDAAFTLAREEGAKAVCSNYVSLALAMPGKDIPVRVRFTRTSFKAWAAYVQKIGTEERLQPHEALTRIKLDNVKGAHGEYSVARFELVKPLPPKLRDYFAAQVADFRALLRRSAETDEPEASTSDDGREALRQARKAAEETAEAGL